MSGLYGSGGEASASADALNVIHEWDLRVAGEDKVTVHAVHKEIIRDGSLRGRQALRDHRAAVDTARTGWMPQRSGIGEDVLLTHYY